MESFEDRRARLLAQLRSLNDQLDRWAEWETAATLGVPAKGEPPGKVPPDELRELRGYLMAEISDLEEQWERRN